MHLILKASLSMSSNTATEERIGGFIHAQKNIAKGKWMDLSLISSSNNSLHTT